MSYSTLSVVSMCSARPTVGYGLYSLYACIGEPVYRISQGAVCIWTVSCLCVYILYLSDGSNKIGNSSLSVHENSEGLSELTDAGEPGRAMYRR